MEHLWGWTLLLLWATLTLTMVAMEVKGDMKRLYQWFRRKLDPYYGMHFDAATSKALEDRNRRWDEEAKRDLIKTLKRRLGAQPEEIHKATVVHSHGVTSQKYVARVGSHWFLIQCSRYCSDSYDLVYLKVIDTNTFQTVGTVWNKASVAERCQEAYK